MVDNSKVMKAPLKVVSYNCRGFNKFKANYIGSILDKCDILLLQELWLSAEQLAILGNVKSHVLFTGVSGFDRSEVLAGRPYGGCAILWHSNLLATVTPIDIDNRRVCCVRISTDSWKLLVINVYMPYEDGDVKTDEFTNELAVIENIIMSNADCHIVVGGDFNADFSRD